MSIIRLVTGFDPLVDRCGVGSYADQLIRAVCSCEDDSRFEILNLKPTGFFEWIRFVREFLFGGVVHYQYPLEAWGNSVVPGIVPVIVRLFSFRTKILLTLHEWQRMHILRRLSVVPAALFAHHLIFVSTREFVSFSESSVGKLRSVLGGKCSVIPIGVNINISELSSETLTHERENALQSGQFELLLGYFGFIYSAKQPFKMLDIVKNLNHRGVKTKLIICGDFPDGHSEEKRKFIEYIELFNLNNFVDLRGYIDNEAALQLILSACDLNIQLYDDGVSTRRSSFWYAIEAGLNVITTKPHLQQEFVDIENFDVFNDSKLTLVDIDIPVSNMVEEICKLKAKWTPPLRRHVAVSWKDIGLSHVKIYREAEAAL